MKDIEPIVLDLENELDISEPSIHSFVDTYVATREDKELLKELAGSILNSVDKLVEGFMLLVLPNQERMDGIIDKRNQESYKSLLKDYLLELSFGNYDLSYVRSRLKTGIIHQKLNIPPQWYLAGYSWIATELISISFDAYGEESPKLKQRISALVRLLLFDIGLILESYFHTDHHHIEYLATHDTVTGLPNQFLFEKDFFRKTINSDPTNPSAILLIGINRFKSINATFGQSIGDRILREVALRLKSEPDLNLVSMYRGGQFIAASDCCIDRDDILNCVNRITRHLSQPVVLDEFSIEPEITIGITVANDSSVEPNGWIEQAQTALTYAKKKQLPYVIFHRNMDTHCVEHLALIGELQHALVDDQLMLYYQPKINIRDGNIFGVEALLRWNHPEKGLMVPGWFLPLAEQTPIIHSVTDWVLEQAVEQALHWQNQGINLIVSINLSAPNLINSELPETLRSLLKTSGLSPSRIVLEITENDLMSDPSRSRSILHRLRGLGVRLSIDDMGTGYTSLAYLKALPIDEIKIDPLFISRMAIDERDERFVEAIIALGHSLGLSVAAKGIEDEATLHKLDSYNCDTAQGFYISEPIPFDQLRKWLRSHSSIQCRPLTAA